MRTYFAHYRVIGSGHPLNGGLGGYYHSDLPWVPRAAGYNPKLSDMTSSHRRHVTGEPYTPYQETTSPLQDEEMGPPM
jgi:hypothetical protein